MDGPVCEELAGAVQRKCFISQRLIEVPVKFPPLPPPPPWNGERTRMGEKNLITPGEEVALTTNTVHHGETIFRFSYVRCSVLVGNPQYRPPRRRHASRVYPLLFSNLPPPPPGDK